MFAHHGLKIRAGDADILRCVADIPAVSLQRGDDELAFKVGDGLIAQHAFQLEEFLVAPGCLAFGEGRLAGMQCSGQMALLDDFAVA